VPHESLEFRKREQTARGCECAKHYFEAERAHHEPVFENPTKPVKLGNTDERRRESAKRV